MMMNNFRLHTTTTHKEEYNYLESSNGPPLLPGLMAASVWMPRPNPDTTPVVSVLSNPKGLPMASVCCPTRSASESPSAAGRSSDGGALIRMTARSFDRSTPTRTPSNVCVTPSGAVRLCMTHNCVKVQWTKSTSKRTEQRHSGNAGALLWVGTQAPEDVAQDVVVGHDVALGVKNKACAVAFWRVHCLRRWLPSLWRRRWATSLRVGQPSLKDRPAG